MSPREDTDERLAVVEANLRNLCVQLVDFRKDVMDRIDEISKEIKQIATMYNSQQITCAARGQQMKTVEEQAIDHEQRIKAIERATEKAMQAINLITWIGAAFGILIIGLLWALFTGQAELIFK